MDLFANPMKRDKLSPFVKLLWEKGTSYEEEVIASLDIPFLDLTPYSQEEKESKTLEAIERKEPLIYSGRISADDLLGEPDLLRLDENGYVAGDIKSGAGEEGVVDDRRPKKHYAVQLALYTDILERKGLSSKREPFVWDIHGDEVTYELDELTGKRNPTTLWNIYQGTLDEARRNISNPGNSSPAYSSICKLCHWRTECMKTLERSDDLTLLPDLGRSKREEIIDRIATVDDLANIEIEQFIDGRNTIFRGIGIKSLEKFKARADLIKSNNAEPYLTEPVALPDPERELFFDIEDDPLHNFCYLHGFVERSNSDNNTEKYVAFFADDLSPEAEEQAFADAWRYIMENQPCTVYIYSKHERTTWRKLQSKYSSVCSEEEIETLFDPDNTIDLLHDVVRKYTEWPTHDHTLKTLAQYLDFKWRDTDPSGAASIEWFQRWSESEDPKIKQRILEYNEDDCLATRVLLDKIKTLDTIN
jgi:predicted RecB family nuclease